MEMDRKEMFRGKKSWNDIESELGEEKSKLKRIVKRNEKNEIERMEYEIVRKMKEKDRIEKKKNKIQVNNQVIQWKKEKG